MQTVIEASEEVLASEKLREILKLILALANYMNNGTFRGNMDGFQWGDLVKLGETRGLGGTTLLHFLVDTIERQVGSAHVCVCVCVCVWKCGSPPASHACCGNF